MGYATILMVRTTQSRKTYRNEGRLDLEYSPLVLPSWGDEEGIAQVYLQSAIQLIRHGFLGLPPPPTPPPISPPSPATSPVPPPPPPQFSMENSVKLPLFKGLGNEDPDQFWFIVKAVWEAQGVIDDNMNKETLLSALQDCTLTRYIKYSNDNPNAGVEDI